MNQYELLKQYLTLLISKLPYTVDLSAAFDTIDDIRQREDVHIRLHDLSKSFEQILQNQLDKLRHENEELKRIIAKYDEKMEVMKKLIAAYNLSKL